MDARHESSEKLSDKCEIHCMPSKIKMNFENILRFSSLYPVRPILYSASAIYTVHSESPEMESQIKNSG